jgi:hypothetical protein
MGNILVLENVRGRQAARARDRQFKLGAVLRMTRICCLGTVQYRIQYEVAVFHGCDIFFFQGARRRDSRESHVPTPLPHTIRAGQRCGMFQRTLCLTQQDGFDQGWSHHPRPTLLLLFAPKKVNWWLGDTLRHRHFCSASLASPRLASFLVPRSSSIVFPEGCWCALSYLKSETSPHETTDGHGSLWRRSC